MKFTVQDLSEDDIDKLVIIEERYRLKGIRRIHNIDGGQFKSLSYRDAYYNIKNKINNGENLGHAICLAGLRRTGKSTLLNQLYLNSQEFGVKPEEILYITLSVTLNGKETARDSFDAAQLANGNKIKYPALEDLNSFIQYICCLESIKCIMIDEVTLCEDLILAGKGFIDSLVNKGIIVILAGTESASFHLAGENSLYSRLILEDISYIPFGEYCRLKNISVSTPEEKQKALDRYIKHGDMLDDTVESDDKYLENALGVNVALSIVNSDYEEFIGCEHDTKELVQSIIKYFKLIGESITIKNIQSQITRADITRAIKNENSRREINKLNIKKSERIRFAQEGAEDAFQIYNLGFGLSEIELSYDQLARIDELFTKMGLLYNLSIIPEVKTDTGGVEAEDLTILHGLSYYITEGIIRRILSSHEGISDEDAESLVKNIESAAKGRLLEEIIAIQFIKGIEKKQELLKCLRVYKNSQFKTERKCTKHRIYKYNDSIFADGRQVQAEIDLVISEPDVIKLIEVKKSNAADINQTKWLDNEIVVNEIRNRISRSKSIKKYVYYLGEKREENGIYYENIADILLEHYNNNFDQAIFSCTEIGRQL